MYKEWEPDACIVEAKAAGSPLIFELRRMGIPVSEYTPVRGNDKFVRINSVTDLFQSGKVWAPEARWADELIEQMAAFPNAPHDDLVDSLAYAEQLIQPVTFPAGEGLDKNLSCNSKDLYANINRGSTGYE